jgi:hypothetical protein
MKIIEQKDWSTWTYVFKCVRCESKLEAEVDDIVHTPESGGNSRDYCPETFCVFCTLCKQSQYIAATEVANMPEMVKHTARKRSEKTYAGAYYDR